MRSVVVLVVVSLVALSLTWALPQGQSDSPSKDPQRHQPLYPRSRSPPVRPLRQYHSPGGASNKRRRWRSKAGRSRTTPKPLDHNLGLQSTFNSGPGFPANSGLESFHNSVPDSRIGSVPRYIANSVPGSIQNSVPGSIHISVPGLIDNSVPGSMQNSMPGPIYNSLPGSFQNSVPGSYHNSVPGSIQNSVLGLIHSSMPGSIQAFPTLHSRPRHPPPRWFNRTCRIFRRKRQTYRCPFPVPPIAPTCTPPPTLPPYPTCTPPFPVPPTPTCTPPAPIPPVPPCTPRPPIPPTPPCIPPCIPVPPQPPCIPPRLPVPPCIPPSIPPTPPCTPPPTITPPPCPTPPIPTPPCPHPGPNPHCRIFRRKRQNYRCPFPVSPIAPTCTPPPTLPPYLTCTPTCTPPALIPPVPPCTPRPPIPPTPPCIPPCPTPPCSHPGPNPHCPCVPVTPPPCPHLPGTPPPCPHLPGTPPPPSCPYLPVTTPPCPYPTVPPIPPYSHSPCSHFPWGNITPTTLKPWQTQQSPTRMSDQEGKRITKRPNSKAQRKTITTPSAYDIYYKSLLMWTPESEVFGAINMLPTEDTQMDASTDDEMRPTTGRQSPSDHDNPMELYREALTAKPPGPMEPMEETDINVNWPTNPPPGKTQLVVYWPTTKSPTKNSIPAKSTQGASLSASISGGGHTTPDVPEWPTTRQPMTTVFPEWPTSRPVAPGGTNNDEAEEIKPLKRDTSSSLVSMWKSSRVSSPTSMQRRCLKECVTEEGERYCCQTAQAQCLAQPKSCPKHLYPNHYAQILQSSRTVFGGQCVTHEQCGGPSGKCCYDVCRKAFYCVG